MQQADGPRPTTAGGVSPWLIAPTVGLAAFMEVLDISIVNVSLQHVAGSMAATPDEATWVLTSYLVTNAVVLPISGWLSETFGRKRYFLGSIIGFSITSLFCGLAPTLPLLIVARGLQGIAGGGLQPTCAGLPRRRVSARTAGAGLCHLRPRRRVCAGDRADGRRLDHRQLDLALGVSDQRAGRHLGQRAGDAHPHRSAGGRRGQTGAVGAGLRLDYIGFALLAIGMFALQFVLDKGQEDDWFGSALITDLVVTAAVALAAFVVWELRRADPIVDLHLFRDRAFASGNMLMFMLGFALMGTTVVLPLFVQTLLGYTAEQAGMVLSPGGFRDDVDDAGGRHAVRADRREAADRGRADRHRDRDVPFVRVRSERRFLDARLGAGLPVAGDCAAVHPDQHRRLPGRHRPRRTPTPRRSST